MANAQSMRRQAAERKREEAWARLVAENPALAIQPNTIVRYSNPEAGEQDLTFTVLEVNGDRLVIESRDFPDARFKPQEVVAVSDVESVEEQE